jgi:hypothetical protein
MSSPDPHEALVDSLSRALGRDFGGPSFPSPEGYRFVGARLRTFRRTVPVVELAREGQTLSFIVTPTDPKEPAYKRSARYDIVYFSEDVPDDQQSKIHARDRAVIDRFVAWLSAWDRAGGVGS